VFVSALRATVHDGRQEAFGSFFHEIAIPLVQGQPGLLAVPAGMPRPETPAEFGMAMVWRDREALEGFTGEGWRNAHVHPDEADIVRESDEAERT
jgi:hypothetical protein